MSSEPEGTGLESPSRPVEAFADREARNPLFRHVVHLGLPVAVSIGAHVGIFVFLAVQTFDVVMRQREMVGEWEGTVVNRDEIADAFSWDEEVSFELPEVEPIAEPLDALDALRSLTARDLTELSEAGSGTGAGTGEGLGIGDGALSLLGTGAGAGEAGTGGFGEGFGSGGTGIGHAGIWDLRIRANKIAYVVDFSGSILVAVDDLKRELKRSVGRLQPSQSFNVIVFYSAGGGRDERVRTEGFESKLVPATQEATRDFFTWIDRKAPKGVTEPLPAIRQALALNPEAVFFFSDGYFDDEVVDEITRANRLARASIHCLVFDEMLLQDTSGMPRETEGVRRLKRVAEANRGKVKVVTGADLAR